MYVYYTTTVFNLYMIINTVVMYNTTFRYSLYFSIMLDTKIR